MCPRKIESSGSQVQGCQFSPNISKHAGQTCGGVQIHVTNRETFESVISGVAIVKTCHDLYRKHFNWKEPPYEYVFDKNPFDVIAGSNKIRAAIEGESSIDSIAESWNEELKVFQQLKLNHQLY